MSIYDWKLGDIAMARLCKKVYAKVQVVKNEDGIFYDDKGITADGDTIKVTEELCYYVEIIRSKHRLWLPYTSLHLAARSRPFYGPNEKPPQVKPPTVTRKRKIINDHTLPINVKPSKAKEPDLNTSLDLRLMPFKTSKFENAFKEFVRRGKEQMFDTFLLSLNEDEDAEVLHYLYNVDASTEDKFEMVIKNSVTEKEVDNYLHQCWRYNFVHKQTESGDTDNKQEQDLNLPVTVHVGWCLVCGVGGAAGRPRECPRCPAAFHLPCRREWLVTILHRKNPPNKTQKPATVVEKILSSTRTICSVQKEKENLELCPSCMWGPRVGYSDVVWHKLGSCAWWPARVLPPGAAPACLLARARGPRHWPLQYYGTLNYSWGEAQRMCLFMPSHTAALTGARDPMLKQAVLDACDDYIAVYLT